MGGRFRGFAVTLFTYISCTFGHFSCEIGGCFFGINKHDRHPARSRKDRSERGRQHAKGTRYVIENRFWRFICPPLVSSRPTPCVPAAVPAPPASASSPRRVLPQRRSARTNGRDCRVRVDCNIQVPPHAMLPSQHKPQNTEPHSAPFTSLQPNPKGLLLHRRTRTHSETLRRRAKPKSSSQRRSRRSYPAGLADAPLSRARRPAHRSRRVPHPEDRTASRRDPPPAPPPIGPGASRVCASPPVR